MDEFFDLVGSDERSHRLCRRIMLQHDGRTCNARVTDDPELMATHGCVECGKRYLKCTCRAVFDASGIDSICVGPRGPCGPHKPLSFDDNAVVFGDDRAPCPYRKGNQDV